MERTDRASADEISRINARVERIKDWIDQEQELRKSRYGLPAPGDTDA
jgi:hypothetical protein